jgi:hypothetical protein
MRPLLALLVSAVLLAPAANAQERSGPKKNLAFPEAIELAKKNVEQEKLGAAIAALQAAINDLQKKQRTAVLAALPKPDGWAIHDPSQDEQADAVSAGLLGVGSSTSRRYRKGEQEMHVEITANSPLMQMLGMMFTNPALVEADGGEIVRYGQHKAILKKQGDDGQELMLLMHDTHLIKVSSTNVGSDDLLRVFDQGFVDRLEKPLGK